MDEPGPDLESALEALLRAGVHPLDALAQALAAARRPAGPPPPLHRAGPWQLTRLLGTGGMGVTWAAVDDQGNVAAVKVTEIVGAAQRARFEAECQALLRLQHPRIVRYRGHGLTDTGQGWLAMDLVEGVPLAALLDAEAADPDATDARTAPLLALWRADQDADRGRRRALRLVLAVAEGLAAAHQLGIVHRDLKPANILVTQQQEPVLIDFGLSRNLFRVVSLTRTGDLLGTLGCMAPEQLVDTERADARTDVYALGLLLYRLLLGRDLRATPEELLRARPRPLHLGADAARRLDAPLQAILYRCLELRPARRYAHAGELAEDLRAALGAGTVRARRPGALARGLRHPHAHAWLLVLCAVALLFASWQPWQVEPCELLVDAFIDHVHAVSLDGGPPQNLPARFGTTPGRHELRVAHPEMFGPLVREIVIPPGQHVRRELFLNVASERPQWRPRAPRDLPGLAAGRTAWLFVHTVPDATVWLDQTELRAPDGWWRVPAGRCVLRARGACGEETQVLALAEHEAHGATLLGAGSGLAGVKGEYRRTVATLLDLPEGVEWIDQEDGIGLLLNQARDKQDEPHMQAKVVLTAQVPRQWRRATVRVRFPKAMRSLAVQVGATVRAPDQLQLHWRMDGGDWQELAASDSGPTESRAGAQVDQRRHWNAAVQLPDPEQGVRILDLRVSSQVDQPPEQYSLSEAFLGVVDPVGEIAPALTVVADPAPGVVRLPR